MLDEDALRGPKGLGESVIMKMLAICHPERFIPVYPYSGPEGQADGCSSSWACRARQRASRGELQVAANDALRAAARPLLPRRPLGWRSSSTGTPNATRSPRSSRAVDPLDDLAEELLVDRAFLDDIVALLEDKGQVIFYGPPGTGKTYLARKLAEALVPDADAPAARPVPPVDVVRGLLRGLPTRDRRRRRR